MSGARRLLRAAQHLLPAGGDVNGTTVLAYHLVGAGTGVPVDLDRDVFGRQMRELREIAEVVPLRSLTSQSRSGTSRPRAAITFDDAYANFLTRAWPVLADLSLPATLFVPVGFLEGTHPPPIRGTEGLPPAAWSDLAVAAAGDLLDIGSHSWTHADLRQVPDEGFALEIAASRRHLAERLGVEIDTFCYPRGLWNRRVERAVASEYERAVIGGGRRWAPSRSPWRIQRISLRRDGPASLEPLLAAPVWLEEWAADRVRRLRPSAGGGR